MWLTRDTGRARAAVLGFRPDHQGDIAMGVRGRAGLAAAFELLRLPRRPHPLQDLAPHAVGPAASGALPAVVSMPFAPYGGFLAHRDVYTDLGLPDPNLVLYADDTEVHLAADRPGAPHRAGDRRAAGVIWEAPGTSSATGRTTSNACC